MVLNIERTGLDDQEYEVVLCFHVLEHVDDRAALAEIRRILDKGGLALFMVPIIEGWSESYENDNIVTDAERDAHFGQPDHIRYYGADFRNRIDAAGFELTEYTSIEPFVGRYELLRARSESC